jgi:hypothetical protein
MAALLLLESGRPFDEKISMQGGKSMKDQWEHELSCAVACNRCNTKLAAGDQRILSVLDHQPICLACKKAEEKHPDYAEASKNMIGTCMMESEVIYGDPGGYCYFHFYPFTCDD